MFNSQGPPTRERSLFIVRENFVEEVQLINLLNTKLNSLKVLCRFPDIEQHGHSASDPPSLALHT